MYDQDLENVDSVWKGEQLLPTLNAQRQRTRDFLSSQRVKLEHIELRLIDQIDHIARQLENVHLQLDQESVVSPKGSEGFQRQADQHGTREALFTDLQGELDQRPSELKDAMEQDHATANWKLGELDSLHENLQQQSRELSDCIAEMDRREKDIETAWIEIAQSHDENAPAEAYSAAIQVIDQEITQRIRELEQHEIMLADWQRDIDQQQLGVREQAEQCQLEHQKNEKRNEELVRQDQEIQAQETEMKYPVTPAANQQRFIAGDFKVNQEEFLAEMDRRRLELGRVVVEEDHRLQQELLEMTTERDRIEEDRKQLRVQFDKLNVDHRKVVAKLEENNQAADEAAALITRLQVDRDAIQAEFESQIIVSDVALTEAKQDLKELRRQLTDCRDALDQQSDEVTIRQAEVDEVSSRSTDVVVTDSKEYHALASEYDRTAGFLDELNRQREDSPVRDISAADEELQRLYELAMEDLRDTKSENENLMRQLAEFGDEGSQLAGDTGNSEWDWETQKRKILAQLDGVDEDNPVQVEERFRAEKVIQVTDRLVAEKDKKIIELQERISAEPRQLTEEETLVIGKILDHDELVCQERENLRRVQEEWRDKLRQAEIEISVERAKIARERAQLDKQLHSFGSVRAQQEAAITSGSSVSPDNPPTKRRWLQKLGLGSSDEPD